MNYIYIKNTHILYNVLQNHYIILFYCNHFFYNILSIDFVCNIHLFGQLFEVFINCFIQLLQKIPPHFAHIIGSYTIFKHIKHINSDDIFLYFSIIKSDDIPSFSILNGILLYNMFIFFFFFPSSLFFF